MTRLLLPLTALVTLAACGATTPAAPTPDAEDAQLFLLPRGISAEVRRLVAITDDHEGRLVVLDEEVTALDAEVAVMAETTEARLVQAETTVEGLSERVVQVESTVPTPHADDLVAVDDCVPLFEQSAEVMAAVWEGLEGGLPVEDVLVAVPTPAPTAAAAACVLDVLDGAPDASLERAAADLMAMAHAASDADAWLVGLGDAPDLSDTARQRKAGVSRIKFRELALAGRIPGVTKASW